VFLKLFPISRKVFKEQLIGTFPSGLHQMIFNSFRPKHCFCVIQLSKLTCHKFWEFPW